MSETATNKLTLILEAVKTVGFPIVACAVVGWFMHDTVQWEREQMLPAIQQNTVVLERVLDRLRDDAGERAEGR